MVPTWVMEPSRLAQWVRCGSHSSHGRLKLSISTLCRPSIRGKPEVATTRLMPTSLLRFLMSSNSAPAVSYILNWKSLLSGNGRRGFSAVRSSIQATCSSLATIRYWKFMLKSWWGWLPMVLVKRALSQYILDWKT